MIAAIDASLTNTAVCCGNAAGYEMHTFGSAPSGPLVARRIVRYLDLAGRVVTAIRERGAETVLIEAYSFGSSGSALTGLAEYGGILRWKLTEFARVYEVAPSTLKKFVTGKGVGKKLQMVSALSRSHDVNFDTDDEYDAFGLFRLGLVLTGQVEAENQSQAEAVHTVLHGAKKKRKARA